MIEKIIKRNGTVEDFMPTKVNRWGEWAARTLGDKVDWSSIVLDTVGTLPRECTSQLLQERLIKTCLDHDTWSYNRMAGRLYAALIHKKLYDDKFPTVKALHDKLVGLGLMVKLDYTDAEYEEVNRIINHKLDFKSAHYSIHQVRSKYALQNRVTGEEYESPQFVYMRMAMALGEDQPKYRRMKDVAKWYEHFSEKRINAPTPNYVNLGTPLKGFASCCLYTTADTARSLAIGNHIAATMTYMSAGIGSHINCRSILDPVRGGVIKHQGKLPYYRALVGEVESTLQNGRGGACTTYVSVYDPEIEVIAHLKNPMSTEDKKIRGLDYNIGFNKFFARKAAKNEEVFLFNSFTAPDLYLALYNSDQSKFESLYAKYESDSSFKKKYVNAREILITVLNQSYETGRIYLHWIDEMNTHTPFKETIWSSNLCLSGDTIITVRVGDEGKVLTLKELDELFVENKDVKVLSYDINSGKIEYKPVLASAKTGIDRKVMKITDNNTGKFIICTPEHKVYTLNRGYVEAKELNVEDSLAIIEVESDSGKYGITIEYLEETIDVYDITVEDNHNFFANDILVHNCAEISLPTEAYLNMKDLYTDDENVQGEIALCSLGAIVVPNIESDEQYEEVAYYTLLMIDKCIHMSHYELPHLGVTAKSRLNAGVGIIGLAHLMAKHKASYMSVEGKRLIHEVAERHAYNCVKASLKLGQELGNAPWIHKTKWVEGWLPIDSYNKNVDSIADFKLKCDWETLRQEIISNGGIRNCSLIAHMPTESSSLASETTNCLYPVRDLTLIKTDNNRVNYWAAPDGDKLGKFYEIAWDIPTKDIIELYAIVQKFTDQAISADLYRRLVGDAEIGSAEMIKDFLYMTKLGLKTRYYVNTKTSDGLELGTDDLNCESCKL